VPGTRCVARAVASKQAAKSVPGTRCVARAVASKQAAKSVPGTRCVARADASKQAAQIGARHPVRSPVSRWPAEHCMVSNSLTSFGSAIQERLVAAVHRLVADGYDSTADDSGSSDEATCRQTVEALLAPLSTAWQRMATGKETKEGPNRC